MQMFMMAEFKKRSVELLALCADNILYYAKSFERGACDLERAE